MYDTKKHCTHTRVCAVRARADIQRPFVLYSHDIEKYVNLKKIYISYVYTYIYVYMYIHCICALCIHYVTLIGSLNTLDTAWFPVPSLGAVHLSSRRSERRTNKTICWRLAFRLGPFSFFEPPYNFLHDFLLEAPANGKHKPEMYTRILSRFYATAPKYLHTCTLL